MTPTSSRGSGWGVLPLVTGLLMALVATGASFVVTLTQDISNFPEIMYACGRNGLTPPACREIAIHAGGISVAVHGFLFLFFALVLWANRNAKSITVKPVSEELKKLFLVFSFVLFGAHLAKLLTTLPTGSRIDDLERMGIFVSLENFLWPLLIQFYVLETRRGLKLLSLSALILTCLLTPYRAVGLAISIFAFFLPLVAHFGQAWRSKSLRAESRALKEKLAVAIVVWGCILGAGYMDTAARLNPRLFASDLPNEMAKFMQPVSPDVPLPPPPSRLMQRLAYPLYQAAIVHHLAQSETLPGPMDEIRRKFLLSDKPTLNQYVYQRIYLGHGVGQTTSLSYGEAAAYVPALPWAWMVGAPLVLIGLWFLFIRRGLQISNLIGIALWRSSQAGFVTLIPGLTLQLIGCVLLVLGSPFMANHARTQRLTSLLSYGGIRVAFTALFLLVSMNLYQVLFLGKAINAQMTTHSVCSLNAETVLQTVKDQIGGKFRYELQIFGTQYAIATVRGGEAELNEVSKALSLDVRCPKGVSNEMLYMTKNPIKTSFSPLHILALLTLGAGLCFLWDEGKKRKAALQKGEACA